MPKISAKLKRGHRSPQRRRQMQVGYVECKCDSCKLATFYAKHCQLSSVASLSHSLSQSASILLVCSTFAVMQRVKRVCQRQLIYTCHILAQVLLRNRFITLPHQLLLHYGVTQIRENCIVSLKVTFSI